MSMKKIEEFVPEDIIEKMIAALKENYERLPIGKPRTAVLQLLVPFIMKNLERGESARKIVSILNKLCYIVNIEDIESIAAAHSKDTKQRRRSKNSKQNDTENDNSVQSASSGSKEEAFGTEKDLSGEEKVPNEVGKENVNGSVRDDLEPKEDLKDHHKDDLGSNNGHEKDIGEHDPGPKEDTAGGAQGQNESEQVPKNKGTFVVKPDIKDI